MYITKGRYRGKKLLKRIFVFFAAFCSLSGTLALTQSFRAGAADEYAINVTSNDTSMGGFGYGSDCSGTIYGDYHAVSDNPNTITFPEGSNGSITACPYDGYVFSRWEVDGSPISYDSATIYQWTVQNYNSDNKINIEAIFTTPKTAEIYAPNGVTVTYTQGISVQGNETDHMTVITNTEKTIEVQVRMNNGYRISSSNPVSTTGGVTYNNDYDNYRFTLTISGDGTATVNIEQITYSTTINAGTGTATVPSSENYSVTGDGTSSVIVSATNTYVSVPVTVTPPSGYMVDSVSATGGATYNNDLNGNNFSFTISDDGGQVSVNYVPLYTVTINAGSGTATVSGNNILVTDNNTSLVSVSAAGSITVNVVVNPPEGYRIDSSNPVTVTGDVGYSNPNRDSFSLDMTGAGAVTVNYVEDTATSFIVAPNNASYGGINIVSGWCYADQTVYGSQTVYLGEYGLLDIPAENAMACATNGSTFSRWVLDDTILVSTEPALSKRSYSWPDDGKTHTLTAVFESSIVTPYTVGSADYTLGSYAIGYDCNTSETADRSLDYVNGALNTNGLPIMACPLNNNTFLRWELDGKAYSQNNQIQANAASLLADGQAHVLRAIFVSATPEQYELPFTGSAMIWVLVGGGVGLVAIPSVILIISERKEQNKGGKK